MRYIEIVRAHKTSVVSLILLSFLVLVSTFALSRGPKSETIEASAMGTGTQMGAVIGVTLDIYEYSTPEDRQILIEAFTKGQNQGLVNALSEMEGGGPLLDHRNHRLRRQLYPHGAHSDRTQDCVQ